MNIIYKTYSFLILHHSFTTIVFFFLVSTFFERLFHLDKPLVLIDSHSYVQFTHAF